jgi:hypothetical protein
LGRTGALVLVLAISGGIDLQNELIKSRRVFSGGRSDSGKSSKRVQPKGESRLKKQCQIDQHEVQQFRWIATERYPNIQMILPLAEIGFALSQRAR